MAINSRIVLTKPDRSVSIICPSITAIRWMGSGGRWPHATRGWIEAQRERHIAAGHLPHAVDRYIKAMMFGGCTTAEALGIIRDRDCAHRGTGIELWPVEDVPSDRWFRNAWRRSPNGGQIWTDLDAARFVQMKKCVHAVKDHNRRQDTTPELWGHNGPQFIELDHLWIKRKCETARDLAELRAVWPLELTL